MESGDAEDEAMCCFGAMLIIDINVFFVSFSFFTTKWLAIIFYMLQTTDHIFSCERTQ